MAIIIHCTNKVADAIYTVSDSLYVEEEVVEVDPNEIVKLNFGDKDEILEIRTKSGI